MRAKAAFLVGATILLALPAIAQQARAPAPQPAPPAGTTTNAAPATAAAPASEADESGVELVSGGRLFQPAPPIEYPTWARRDPWTVGPLDALKEGLGSNPWGNSSGA